ncbi:MAG: O-antigen ligase family protein [Planctomycetota bacterium]|nr:O-antigen ligase family protein [Planctomycetota bacterium]MDA1179763.1 O-antigen ligase family protein [Planctomycetota bacterium]
MFVIVAILVILAMVWGAVFFRYAGLLPACLVTLVAGICWGSEFFHVSVLTIDRALWAVTFGMYLLYRRLGVVARATWTSVDFVTIAFLSYLGLSALMHDWRWNEGLPATRLLFYYIVPFTMYLVARDVTVSSRGLRYAYLSMGVFGIYLGLTAVAEATGRYGLVFPRYIASPDHVEFFGRGRGPLLNPSGNGVLLATCLFALWMLWPHARNTERTAIVTATLLIGAGILATLTRCVWMGAGLGALIILLLTIPVRYRQPLVLSIALLGGLVVLANWQTLTAFKRDKNVSVADMKKSAKLRPILAYVAWEMFQDRPLMGVGFAQYKKWDKHYLGDRSTDLVLEQVRPYHQHNVFLSLLTETGLIGMSLYTGMLLMWSQTAWRLWTSRQHGLEIRQLGLFFLASLSAYLVNGMFQDVAIVPMLHNLLFFLAGLTVGRAAASTVSSQYGRIAIDQQASIFTAPQAAR